LRGEKSYHKSGHEASEDGDEPLVTPVNVMPCLWLACILAVNVPEHGAG
jgi:hypothetical protein